MFEPRCSCECRYDSNAPQRRFVASGSKISWNQPGSMVGLSDKARLRLAFVSGLGYEGRASRPGSRAPQLTERWRFEESPGSMEQRCRITSGGGDPRESATESKPPRHLNVSSEALRRRGKGERVG